jgi:hypothetical protein
LGMSRFRRILLSMFCLMVAAMMTVNATVVSVGVKKDDWIQWHITVTDRGQSTTTWIKVTIQETNTTTTTISGTYESNQPGWPTDPTFFVVDLLTGDGVASIYNSTSYAVPLIASPNLTAGDFITGTSLKINGTTTRDGRDAAFASYSNPTLGNTTYYWDTKKGVLLEFSTSYGTATTLMQVSDTNMWNLGRADWTPWIATAIVIACLAAVAVFVLRKRRSSPKARAP